MKMQVLSVEALPLTTNEDCHYMIEVVSSLYNLKEISKILTEGVNPLNQIKEGI